MTDGYSAYSNMPEEVNFNFTIIYKSDKIIKYCKDNYL